VVTPYLGQLKVAWNGLGAAAEPMPLDFAYIEIHSSTVNNFTPTNATLVDQLAAKGEGIVTGLVYDTPMFVKLISVDLVGNKSAASAQATGTPVRVSGLDVAALAIATSNLGDGAVTNIKIADATITSAKIGNAQILNANIANLAVDDAKIASASIGKLTAGSLTADMTVSARIKTANTGARVELNSSGLQAFNTAGTQTVDIAAATGNVTIQGNFKTGIAGGALPYMSIDDSIDRTTVAFWNAAGSKNAYINSPAGTTTPQLGMNTGIYVIDGGVTPGYNRLFLREGSLQLGIVRGSDQTVYGGTYESNTANARMRHAPLGGASTGAEFYADANQGIMTVNTAGVANTAGRVSVTNTQANFEFTDAAGASIQGIFVDSTGVKSFGPFISTIGWSFAPETGWSATEVRIDRWGPFIAVHVFLTRTGGTIAAGNILAANEPVGTITSAGNVPSSQTSVACQWADGIGAASLDSAGSLNLRYLTTAINTNDTIRFDTAYFRT
jgi:hypothetical protein